GFGEGGGELHAAGGEEFGRAAEVVGADLGVEGFRVEPGVGEEPADDLGVGDGGGEGVEPVAALVGAAKAGEGEGEVLGGGGEGEGGGPVGAGGGEGKEAEVGEEAGVGEG